MKEAEVCTGPVKQCPLRLNDHFLAVNMIAQHKGVVVIASATDDGLQEENEINGELIIGSSVDNLVLTTLLKLGGSMCIIMPGIFVSGARTVISVSCSRSNSEEFVLIHFRRVYSHCYLKGPHCAQEGQGQRYCTKMVLCQQRCF